MDDHPLKLLDILTVLAILSAPLFALQVQKWLDEGKEERNRRHWVFKTLMATRAILVSPNHVQALNMIDLEFQAEEFAGVRAAWRTYLDHLGNYPKEGEAQQAVWQEARLNLLTALLIAMGKSLGYNFDDVHIKKGIYSPEAHSARELEDLLMRRGLVRLLAGDSALKMEVTRVPSNEAELAEQKAVRAALQALLDGKRELPVRLTQDSEKSGS